MSTDTQSPIAASESDGEDAESDATTTDEKYLGRRWPRTGAPLLTALSLMIVLCAVAGWIGLQVYRSDQLARQRTQFVEAAQRGALNLTTIDHQHADADVQRILDSSTGTFHDDFAKRSADFVDAVKTAQSRSKGTVTVAALESTSPNQAQVLIAMNVSISDITASEQRPRSWRMRVTVEEMGNDMKVSDVEFVP